MDHLRKAQSDTNSSERNSGGVAFQQKRPQPTPSTALEEPATSSLDYTYPEGGLRAWLTVFGAAALHFCLGQQASFGIFESWYREHQLQHLSLSTISWIDSIGAWICYFTGIFAGRIYDAYGPHVLLIPGTILFVLSAMLRSICTKFYQFLIVQGIMAGLSQGMITYPSLAAISTHFNKKRAAAIGLVVTAQGLGSVLSPILYRFLFARFGFGWGVRLPAFVVMGLCVVGNTTVTSRLHIIYDRTPTPLVPESKTLRDMPYLLFVIGGFFLDFGLLIPPTYIVTYSVSKGVPHAKSFYVSSAMNAGGVAGRLLPVLLADNMGRFNVAVSSSFLVGILILLAWSLAARFASIMAFVVLYGLFAGAFASVRIPCIMQISNLDEIGTKMGFVYTVGSFALLTGGPLAGQLIFGEDYEGAILLSGFTMLLGSIFILAAKLKLNPRLFDRV